LGNAILGVLRDLPPRPKGNKELGLV